MFFQNEITLIKQSEEFKFSVLCYVINFVLFIVVMLCMKCVNTQQKIDDCFIRSLYFYINIIIPKHPSHITIDC